MLSTWRLRNIHDRIGGKSEGEAFIHAEASNNHRAQGRDDFRSPNAIEVSSK
jgi:hypothetical protein